MASFRMPGRSVLSAMSFVVGVACLAFPVGAILADVEGGSPNLVVNPSFEQPDPGGPLPAGWYGTPQVYSVDREVTRSGNASLKYVNDDPARYSLATQSLELLPRPQACAPPSLAHASGLRLNDVLA